MILSYTPRDTLMRK